MGRARCQRGIIQKYRCGGASPERRVDGFATVLFSRTTFSRRLLNTSCKCQGENNPPGVVRSWPNTLCSFDISSPCLLYAVVPVKTNGLECNLGSLAGTSRVHLGENDLSNGRQSICIEAPCRHKPKKKKIQPRGTASATFLDANIALRAFHLTIASFLIPGDLNPREPQSHSHNLISLGNQDRFLDFLLYSMAGTCGTLQGQTSGGFRKEATCYSFFLSSKHHRLE